MSARTIPNERHRLATMMSARLMTCSARLPVFTLLIAAFVPDRSELGPGRIVDDLRALVAVERDVAVVRFDQTRHPGRAGRPGWQPALPAPYVGVSAWIGARLDRDVDWDEIDGIVRDAYRHVAPKTLARQLDAE